MTAILQNLELCAECKQPIRHRLGPICANAAMQHIDPRQTPIRLCLGDFFAYRRKYEAEGWRFVEQEKLHKQ